MSSSISARRVFRPFFGLLLLGLIFLTFVECSVDTVRELIHRASNAIDSHKYEESLKLSTQALELLSELSGQDTEEIYSHASIVRDRSLVHLHKDLEALESLRAEVASHAENPIYVEILVGAYFDLGMIDDAADTAKFLSTMLLGNVYAQRMYASLSANRGRYDDAVIGYERAVGLLPSDPVQCLQEECLNDLITLARVYDLAGKHIHSEAMLDIVYDVAQHGSVRDRERANRARGDVYFLRNDCVRAYSYLREAADLALQNPNPTDIMLSDSDFSAGRIAYQGGLYEAAMFHFNRSHSIDPGNSDPWTMEFQAAIALAHYLTMDADAPTSYTDQSGNHYSISDAVEMLLRRAERTSQESVQIFRMHASTGAQMERSERKTRFSYTPPKYLAKTFLRLNELMNFHFSQYPLSKQLVMLWAQLVNNVRIIETAFTQFGAGTIHRTNLMSAAFKLADAMNETLVMWPSEGDFLEDADSEVSSESLENVSSAHQLCTCLMNELQADMVMNDPNGNVRSDGTVPLPDDRGQSKPRNVVLGAIESYGPMTVKLFLQSLRKTGCEADVVFFASRTSDRIIEVVKEYNASLFLFNRTEGEAHYFGVKSFRYELARRFVAMFSERYKGGRILLTDTRDVFFQRDPFEFYSTDHADLEGDFSPDVGLDLFLEAGNPTIAGCGINSKWISSCWGEKMLTMLGDKTVSCSGTTMGTTEGILRYTEAMLQAMEDVPSRKCLSHDQRFHNYIMYTGRLGEFRALRHDTGPIATLAQEETLRVIDDQVVNANGIPYALVHQWDRFTTTQRLASKLYLAPDDCANRTQTVPAEKILWGIDPEVQTPEPEVHVEETNLPEPYYEEEESYFPFIIRAKSKRDRGNSGVATLEMLAAEENASDADSEAEQDSLEVGLKILRDRLNRIREKLERTPHATPEQETESEDLVSQALKHHENGNQDKAAQLIYRALNLNARSFIGLQVAAMVEIARGQGTAGAEFAEYLAVLYPELEHSYFLLGNAYMRSYGSSNMMKAAVAAFTQVVQINTQNLEGRKNLAVVYYRLGEWGKALIEFRKALATGRVSESVTNHLEELEMLTARRSPENWKPVVEPNDPPTWESPRGPGVVHVGIVSTGDSSDPLRPGGHELSRLRTLVSSIIVTGASVQHLVLHILTDEASWLVTREWIREIESECLTVAFYDIDQIPYIPERFLEETGYITYHKSAEVKLATMWKLFPQYIFDAPQIIMLDTDQVLLRDIGILWRKFEDMENSGQLYGIPCMQRENLGRVYKFHRERLPDQGRTSCVASVVLYRLEAAREANMYSLMVNYTREFIARHPEWVSETGDQDVFNLIEAVSPGAMHRISCEWNCYSTYFAIPISSGEEVKGCPRPCALLHYNAHACDDPMKRNAFFPHTWDAFSSMPTVALRQCPMGAL